MCVCVCVYWVALATGARFPSSINHCVLCVCVCVCVCACAYRGPVVGKIQACDRRACAAKCKHVEKGSEAWRIPALLCRVCSERILDLGRAYAQLLPAWSVMATARRLGAGGTWRVFSVGVGSWNKIPCHTEGSGERPSHRVCVPDLAGSVLDEILSDVTSCSGPKQTCN